MDKRRVIILTTSATVVLVLAIGAFAWVRSGRPIDGPLQDVPPHGWSVEAKVGETIVDGFENLRTVNGTARITAVTIEGDRSIELIGVMVSGAGREIGGIQQPKEWPPTDPEIGTPHDAMGAVIESIEAQDFGTELFIAMKVTKTGQFLRKGIWIDYQSGGRNFREFPSRRTHDVFTGIHGGRRLPVPG